MRIRAVLVALSFAVLLSSCAGAGRRAPREVVTVFAASSLTAAFQEIAEAFETVNEGVEVRLVFGGTPTLRVQLEQGAKADLFASANPDQMRLAVESGVVSGRPKLFIENSLVVITPASQLTEVSGLVDLSREGLKLVLADASVPAGAYALEMLDRMGHSEAYGSDFDNQVLSNLSSLESSVNHVLAKVALGEADAGVVYASDVTTSTRGDLQVFAVPPEFNVRAHYEIALVRDGENQTAARAFFDYVSSAPSQEILLSLGFLASPAAGTGP